MCRATASLANDVVSNATVFILADHHNNPTSHRMERVDYLSLERRKPGIMAPVWTAGLSGGPWR
jgi:hypothetical protein